MKRLGLNYLEPGMVVARPVLRADGGVVVGQGLELTSDYIKRLPSQGITCIYIKDERLGKLDINDVLSERMRTSAVKKAKEINDEFVKLHYDILENKRTGNRVEINVNKLNKLSNQIVDDFLSIKNPMINLIDSRLNEDYLYSHMVNVAALAILLAQAVGFRVDKLVSLAQGCLIHDIGILIGVNHEVRQKKAEELTGEERDVLKKHPRIAYDFLRKIDSLSIMAAHVAYQHHERFNGKGYPRELMGNKITETGYIAGIADVYDAITNGRDPRTRVVPGKAREFLMVAMDKFFPARLIEKFLGKIPVYPNGTSLIFSDKSVGVVYEQNILNLGRPKVKIIEQNGKQLDRAKSIDLMEKNNITVEKVMD